MRRIAGVTIVTAFIILIVFLKHDARSITAADLAERFRNGKDTLYIVHLVSASSTSSKSDFSTLASLKKKSAPGL